MRVAIAAIALTLLPACAVALPAYTGATTTPRARLELAPGGGVRIPLDGSDPHTATPTSIPPGTRVARYVARGVAPILAARYGVDEDLDLGVIAEASALRPSVRQRLLRSEDRRYHLILGPELVLGLGSNDEVGEAELTRYGLLLPLVLGVDFGGVLQLWVGARAGVEKIGGDYTSGDAISTVDLLLLRAGAFLGISAGFRHLHAFVEAGLDYESYGGEVGGQDLDHGLGVLVLAFGLRIRP